MFIILPDGTEVFTDYSGFGQSKMLDTEVLARLHSVLGEGLLVSLLEDGKGVRLTEYREYVWVKGLNPKTVFFVIEDARNALTFLSRLDDDSVFESNHA